METLIIFLGIVMLVFAILQIVLFFKVWGMTNDVRSLKKKFMLSSASLSASDILKESYKGNPKLPNILFDAIYNDMDAAYERTASVYNPKTKSWENDEVVMTKRIKEIKDHYKAVYARVNIPFPEVFDSIKNAGDFEKAFSLS